MKALIKIGDKKTEANVEPLINVNDKDKSSLIIELKTEELVRALKKNKFEIKLIKEGI
jgi:hypothetical protein